VKLVADHRVPGAAHYYLLREDEALPQVPPGVLKCVAFLYPTGGRIPEGTVFFVSISDQDPEPEGNRYWADHDPIGGLAAAPIVGYCRDSL